MACPEIAIHSDLSELAASVVHVRPATLLCMAAWEPIYRELCSLRLLVTRSGKAKNMNPAILGQLTGASENLANIKTLLPNMTRAITMTFATTHSSQEQIRSTWLQAARGIMTDVSKDVLVAISGPVEKTIAQLEASYAEFVEPERNIKAAVEDGSDEGVKAGAMKIIESKPAKTFKALYKAYSSVASVPQQALGNYSRLLKGSFQNFRHASLDHAVKKVVEFNASTRMTDIKVQYGMLATVQSSMRTVTDQEDRKNLVVQAAECVAMLEVTLPPTFELMLGVHLSTAREAFQKRKANEQKTPKQ